MQPFRLSPHTPARPRAAPTITTFSYTHSRDAQPDRTNRRVDSESHWHPSPAQREYQTRPDEALPQVPLGVRRWRPYDWDDDESEEASAARATNASVAAAAASDSTTCEGPKLPLHGTAQRRTFCTPFHHHGPACESDMARPATHTVTARTAYPSAQRPSVPPAHTRCRVAVDEDDSPLADPTQQTDASEGDEDTTCIALSQSSEEAAHACLNGARHAPHSPAVYHSASAWLTAHQQSLGKRTRSWSDRFLHESTTSRRGLTRRTELASLPWYTDPLCSAVAETRSPEPDDAPLTQLSVFRHLLAYYARANQFHRAPHRDHAAAGAASQSGLSSQSASSVSDEETA